MPRSRDEKKRTVPKFGSFKPKAPSRPDSEASPEVSDRSTTKQLDDSDRQREKNSGGRERTPHSSRAEPASDKERLASAARPKHDDIFTIDKRGDPLIRRYGSNDRSRVPAYYRYGSGKLLGSTGLLHIQREGARDEFRIRGQREGISAFRDKNLLLAQAGKTKPRRIKRSQEQPAASWTDDFIALGTSKKRKRGDDEADSSNGQDAPTYRLIEGPAKAQDDSDEELESDSDSSGQGGEVYYVTPAKRRSIELSQRVKDYPDDTDAWLELVHLQDELFRENEDDDHVRTKDEVRGLANLKLSILQKALPNATGSPHRDRVLLRLMLEGSKVWNPDELAKRWIEVTEQNSGSLGLWQARMDFELTNVATFSYENVKKLFVDHLHSLTEVLEKSLGSGDAALVADQAIYVFLRLTCFLREAGFVDLAVGAWQAMLELHFGRPVLHDESRSTGLSSLAEFWESEVPRIGEVGAQGWKKFAEACNSLADFPEVRRNDSRSSPQTRDVYKAWALAEKQRALEARIPARITDEGNDGDSDPYRVVLFSDIDALLFFFPSSLLPGIRRPLLDAYFLFCGQPPPFLSSDILKSALNDPFIYGCSQDFKRDMTKRADPLDSLEEASQRRALRFRQDGSHMALSPEVLFSGRNWFSYLASWRELYDEQDEPVDRSYVLNTARQLVSIFNVEELGEYCLAMQWLEEPSGGRKAAKAMLKQYPSSTRLYNAYALLEWGNGNLEVAQKVLSSVAGRDLSPDSPSQMLWNTWAWIELEAGEKQAAVARLCSSVDGHVLSLPISPSVLLKSRSHLSGRRDYSLSAGALDSALEFATSLALLEYLTSDDGDEPSSESQGNISAAMHRIQSFSDELSRRDLTQSSIHERFLQFAARLLYFHATHGPFRPIYIRTRLHNFVTVFPRNTIFLTLFSWAESSLRIDDPVRALLRETALAETHDSLAGRIFAIRHELRFGTAHSVRAAFESAVEGSEVCKGNAQLWICYVRFCRARKELRGRAKETFYRAVAHCPGSKELYMEAFTTLARDMESAELKSVYNAITGKGLRVHVDLEVFVGRWKRRGD